MDDVTLHRFYSLHFTLPFILLTFTILHLFVLHDSGSTNPIGISVKYDNIPFAPYYVIKDLLLIHLIVIVLLLLVFIVPDALGHPSNYDIADFMVTPTHIVPE